MGELIDDLLELSRVGRDQLRLTSVDVSALARAVADELRAKEPERVVELVIPDGISAHADAGLLRIVVENLVGNAWKFTARSRAPRIELGTQPGEAGTVYYVRDNGAGFSMEHADKLFRPFQRLHSSAEFSGTGIGLATVYRIIDRHGGRVWAEGLVDHGTTVYFTVAAKGRGRA
jgi:light-regulated signal transduction histidine kinase (bacteriophytochrome)